MDISSKLRSHSFDDTSKKLIKDISFFNSLESFDLLSEYHDRVVELERESFDLLVENNNIKQSDSRLEVAVIGNFSSGKSSLINSLLGENVCPVKVNPTTSSVTKFLYSDKPSVYIVQDDGDSKSYKEITPEEYFVMSQHSSGNTSESKFYFFEYHYPFDGFRGIALYDTPGFENTLNDMDERITQNIASQVDVLFVILDVNTGEVSGELLKRINDLKANNEHQKQDFYLILNKADTKSPESVASMRLFHENKYNGYFDKILEYSATDVLGNSNNSSDNLLKLISGKIKNHITEYQEFSFSVRGKIQGRVSKTYEVSVENDTFFIDNSLKRFSQAKSHLLDILYVLSQQKDKISKYRFEYQISKHNENVEYTVSAIKDLCNRIIKNEPYKDYMVNYFKHITHHSSFGQP